MQLLSCQNKNLTGFIHSSSSLRRSWDKYNLPGLRLNKWEGGWACCGRTGGGLISLPISPDRLWPGQAGKLGKHPMPALSSTDVYCSAAWHITATGRGSTWPRHPVTLQLSTAQSIHSQNIDTCETQARQTVPQGTENTVSCTWLALLSDSIMCTTNPQSCGIN